MARVLPSGLRSIAFGLPFGLSVVLRCGIPCLALAAESPVCPSVAVKLIQRNMRTKAGLDACFACKTGDSIIIRLACINNLARRPLL